MEIKGKTFKILVSSDQALNEASEKRKVGKNDLMGQWIEQAKLDDLRGVDQVKEKHMVSFWFDDLVLEKLNKLAKKHGVSKIDVLERLIERM